MAVITHEQRAVLEAVDALTRLEESLSGSGSGSEDLIAKVDSLIEELKAVVGRVSSSRRDAAQSYEDATSEKQDESATRSAGQSDRLCVSRN